jgi:thiazole synthase ThiGH ThiG subunit
LKNNKKEKMTINFDRLEIGNKVFNSRLMLGTGKYRTPEQAISSINSI